MSEPVKKKVCLASGRGKKNKELHAQYENVSETKVRCKECFKKWFVEAVAAEVSRGHSDEEALRLGQGDNTD